MFRLATFAVLTVVLLSTFVEHGTTDLVGDVMEADVCFRTKCNRNQYCSKKVKGSPCQERPGLGEPCQHKIACRDSLKCLKMECRPREVMKTTSEAPTTSSTEATTVADVPQV